MFSLIALCLLVRPQAHDSIWIEGENPSSINVKPTIAGWGHKEFLSGEKWLQVSIDADKVDKELPADGILINYDIQIQSEGTHDLWNRIGYEAVRSPFDWRVDGEEWHRIEPSALTTDMQEFETWNEVAWLKLGSEPLKLGRHVLQIRLPKTVNGAGKTERILYGSDALLITSEPFHPNGKFPPNSDFQSEFDRKAAETTFSLAVPEGAAQQSVDLSGTWQIARDDEALPGKVDAPIADLPKDPIWYGIPVPSDKNQSRPELTTAHRVWYRTRVVVPDHQTEKSYWLTFPQNNLNTTVYVNGKRCGFNKNPLVKWTCDITSGIHPGVNEIWVGIRDAWYGYSSSPTDPMKLRRSFVIPLAMTGGGFQDLAYPVWHGFESGILDTPTLTVAGSVAVWDVFVKPSVANHVLESEVTVRNTTATPVTAQVEQSVWDDKTGKVVKTIPASQIQIPGRQDWMTVKIGAWKDPVLWWPDQPQMYRLRTDISVGGKLVDQCDTAFGFREWSTRGKDLLLNGVVWHGWAELTQGHTKEEWLKNYRATGQRFMRLSGISQNGGPNWFDLSYEKALDWFDRNGVIVRRSGPLDGEAIGYFAIENDPELQTLYHSRIKKQLLENWRDQMVAMVRGERNHPSVGMWSIENEWLYINCINLYGDLMDEFENEEKVTLDAVAQVDPTRPAMADGGGAGKANLFPIQGDHYVYTNDPNHYPDLAYEAFPTGAGRGRWTWDQKRPRYLGEDFFATGINPADYGWIEGEEAFESKVASEKGMAIVQRMLTEGYRWSGEYAAWHLWLGDEGEKFGKSIANSERAVFCRQQNWTFESGQHVGRTFAIFNDSHYEDPIQFTYSVVLKGKSIATGSVVATVPPGAKKVTNIDLAMPTVQDRAAAKLVLTLTVNGKTVFHDEKPFSILPSNAVSTTSRIPIGVYPAHKDLIENLEAQGFAAIAVPDITHITGPFKTLVVGTDVLVESQSSQSTLAAWAANGNRVVVLHQAHPLRFQALPADSQVTSDQGSFGFIEITDHPVFKGLKSSDFQGWTGGVYQGAYIKPQKGGRSLMQVGSRLAETALMEVPVGAGLVLVSQLNLSERHGQNPVSDQLLHNMVSYAASYSLVSRKVGLVADAGSSLAKAMSQTGVRFQRETSVVEALKRFPADLVMVSATEANLHELASNLPAVQKFYATGGTLVFHGLTPAGLRDYSRIVGVEHLIRPFRREKTALKIPRDPLASGLSSNDVVMYSGQKMFDFNDDRFVASDIFDYVVDFDDAAPFAELPSDYLYNTVNGFTSSDSWKYIYSFDLNQGKPEYTMKFARPQTVTEMTWIGNAFYHKVTKFSLTFDGKDTVTFDVPPDNLPHILPIAPKKTGTTIELKILDWTRDPGMANVVGIDNISLKVERPAEFTERVHPLLNVGGLVRYSEGPGSAVLVNLAFKDREEVPENADKKLAILSKILHNLRAEFTVGKTIVAGAANISYSPVDISKSTNQYRNERGWFGDKNQTFADLPSGRHVFAGVPFDIFDFPTSPVPNAIMLGGSGVPGQLPDAVNNIKVAAKASALFFLQAARIDQRRSPDEVRAGKQFEFADYVVHYHDGQTLVIPIRSEIDVEDYRQETPTAIPGAQIGWTHRYEKSSLQAVAYIQQWNNPRPTIEIDSIDLRYGPDRRGVPALLAVSIAR